MNFLSINYIILLILSALSFAVGEFLSKSYVLSHGMSYVLLILLAYCLGIIFWLPVILKKNQFSIIGTIWSVLSLLATISIGILIFAEKLNLAGIVGIIFALAAIALLSV